MEQAILAQYLKSITFHFPDVPVEDARLITKGWDHDVVVLAGRLIFRFPKSRGYESRFRAEVKLLRYLKPKMPVPIPDYVYLPDDLSFGGYKMLQGVEMTKEVFHSFDSAQKDVIAKQCGSFLSTLHTTPLTLARESGFAEDENGYTWSKNYTEQTLARVREKVFPKLSQEEVQWIELQFTRYLSFSFDVTVCVTHSDFTRDHIFVEPGSGIVTGVIDFGDMAYSDPAFDFSGMWHYGTLFPQQVLNYYTLKHDSDFLERSKFPILVDAVRHMLELHDDETNKHYTFEGERARLRRRMESGLHL